MNQPKTRKRKSISKTKSSRINKYLADKIIKECNNRGNLTKTEAFHRIAKKYNFSWITIRDTYYKIGSYTNEKLQLRD
jgi:hypothetical protein